MTRRIADLFVRLGRRTEGSVALIFGLSFPALILIVLVSVELRALAKDKARLQELADTAALNTASQMRVGANEQLLARARSSTMEQAKDLTAKLSAANFTFLAPSEGRSGVRVDLEARRTSFFGNMLPPGGFVIRAEAVAEQLSATPLCVLTLSGTDSLHVQDGDIVARSCMAHSNTDIRLGGKGAIDAAAVQASGAIKGQRPSNAGDNAPRVDDPLVGVFAGGAPPLCTHLLPVKVDKAQQVSSILPGVHCRKLDIEKGKLHLMPGVHHFKSGELQIKEGATIEGTNVTIVIWKDMKVKFDDRAGRLDLTGNQGVAGLLPDLGLGLGPAQDPWAGFALAIDPAWSGDFRLDFNDIHRLEGVVYAPGARLIVPSGQNSNDQTPWTVVIARELKIEGGRRLAINADYASSSVPVPSGVGNKSSGQAPTRLTN